MLKKLIIGFLFLSAIFAGAEKTPEVFTYKLSMDDVDNVEKARRYSGERPSLTGFEGSWTAEKRLPFKAGPGEVRAYVRHFPENDIKVTITIGSLSEEAVIKKDTHRSNWTELKFQLKEASDEIKFKAETLDGKKGRIIWYTTIFTNDPEYKYETFYQHGVKREKFRYQTLKYVREIPANPEGNLLPNSGFEEGIRCWDVQKYRSNEMTKPFLLNKKAAHGNYSLDIGKVKIISRLFVLKGIKDYAFSIYTADENKTPVTVSIEASNDGVFQEVKKIVADNAKASDVKGWKKSAFSFKTLPDEDTNGLYRISFEKPVDAPLKTPLLVDSLQITEGNGKSYEPCGGLEANFIPPNTQSIFDLNSQAKVLFNLQKSPDVLVKNCYFNVYDYFDREVGKKEEIEVKGNSLQKEFCLDTGRSGFYRIRTTAEYTRNGKPCTKQSDYFYNVIRPVGPRNNLREKSLLGAYYTLAPVPEFGYGEIMKKFGIIEFNPLGHPFPRWKPNLSKDSTKENIRYDWTDADMEVGRFAADGIKPVAQLHVNTAGSGYGVPELCVYNGSDPSEFIEVKARREGKPTKINMALWLDYVKQFAEHFKGRVSKYIIEDEPVYYFSPEDYAKFYLATYKAVKSVDPQIPVFFDMFVAKDMKLLNALNKATDNQAYKYMDGIHAYLDSQHSGKISKTAAREFRDYLKEHNIPLVTATCYSPAYSHDFKEMKGAPDFSGEREKELKTVQELLDGVIWGASNCRYFYYGVFPGKNTGACLFDEAGRIKPVFHFYAAANYLLGGHQGTESIDDFEELRIGLVKKGANEGIGIIYSVDGKVYDISMNADGIADVMDSFGNPVKNWKKDGKLNYHISSYPLYLKINDLNAAGKELKALKFTEKLPIVFGMEKRSSGAIGIKLFIKPHSSIPLHAETTIEDPFNTNKVSELKSEKLPGNTYLVNMPYRESVMKAVERILPLNIDTEYGTIFGTYPLRYTPIFLSENRKTPGQDLNLYGSNANKVASVSFAIAENNLNVTFTGTVNGMSFKSFSFTFIPINLSDGELLMNKKTCLEITTNNKNGIISGGEKGKDKTAETSFPVTVTNTKPYSVSFSIPLVKIPDFTSAPGTNYACDIKAVSLQNKNDVVYTNNIYFPDSRKVELINPEQWARLMIVE
ncbi:MAG: hypothetical protein UT30_C0008G0042 [Candidatus Uhrbacteria bacterium GW2011_GWF2_39_13]|uniref:Uncharacterized protein n=1 Tax=Candidatus Uhrbacteria bacterium GW2011_GWF2_39_13 TaxID=1618995 RepID=A0A0G0Q1V4_9BACT|nr:MAG: hypothetical protein UT30_C0008G0042 [Candidatus Uhrbacteria bacterium GW2011_GWF2_39_13]